MQAIRSSLMQMARRRPVLAAVLGTGTAAALAFCTFLLNFDRSEIEFRDDLVFTDRHGVVLRHVPEANGLRHIWTPSDRMPDHLKNAFLAAEDSRFYLHPGFDTMGMVRAVRDNIKSGKIVSGASTITQQLCRVLYPRERTYGDKLIEVLRAARMELYLSKQEILEQYLNRIPMGNNLQGVGLASRIYFGHDVAETGIAEAALLASLPKAPGRLNPLTGDIDRLVQRQRWVLARMLELGYISSQEHDAAVSQWPRVGSMPFPYLAPHALDTLASENGAALSGRVRTTLDSGMQDEVERLLLSHRERLKYMGARQAAILVVRNRDVQALAHAGSFEYEEADGGYNDGASALRSAGSTLKPLLYALAIDSGYTASTVIDDVLRKYASPTGDYVPLNYDRKQYGPVTMRAALGNSLNISAIKVLDLIGIERFYDTLKAASLINHPENGPEHYGLGLVIGNPEVSLRQLVAAYAMLANSGRFKPVTYLISEEGEAHEIFSEETAYIVSDMLSDPTARNITFGSAGAMDFQGSISVKTGTSTMYRDAWAIGYTEDFTVGVWTGNFEGDPTFSVSGASGAAPILKDVFAHIYRGRPVTIRTVPRGITAKRVCGISGMNPGPGCRYVTEELFVRGTEPEAQCAFHASHTQAFTHDLPVGYAPWLYGKNLKGTAAGYRLRGFENQLDEVFSSEGTAGESVVVRGIETSRARPERKPLSNHVSIGSSMQGELPVPNGAEARLKYPNHGERYLMDKGAVPGDSTLLFEAEASGPIAYLDWFVDGRHLKRTPPPYQTTWRMLKGRHEISVVAPSGSGDTVSILIE